VAGPLTHVTAHVHCCPRERPVAHSLNAPAPRGVPADVRELRYGLRD